MRLWRQLKMYKNILLVTLVFNAFLVFTGVGFIVLHYKGQRKTELSYQHHIEQIRSLDHLDSEIELLMKVEKWNGEHWLKLGALQEYAKSHLDQGHLEFKKTLESQNPQLGVLKQNLSEQRVKSFQALVESGKDLGRFRREIVIIAAFSLFFGFILPSIILYILKRMTLKFHAQIEGQVVSTLKIWRSQSLKHEAEGGLASTRFWLDIALLTLAQITKEIDHPLAAYAHQMATKFFQELQNVGASSLNPESKNDIEKNGHVS